ncbi:hypothetical protein T4A_8451 [Trichinella pseudospiralis]|uniref:Uncharacterized protein n=1 Tax=Trichinella pseudospiralis TaxID=6337 RepID=A0A0V1EN59_TRIPS|nr:hypothetical protein T4A_8451 [Trichinella pseudospiralis]
MTVRRVDCAEDAFRLFGMFQLLTSQEFRPVDPVPQGLASKTGWLQDYFQKLVAHHLQPRSETEGHGRRISIITNQKEKKINNNNFVYYNFN